MEMAIYGKMQAEYSPIGTRFSGPNCREALKNVKSRRRQNCWSPAAMVAIWRPKLSRNFVKIKPNIPC